MLKKKVVNIISFQRNNCIVMKFKDEGYNINVFEVFKDIKNNLL